MEEIIETDEIVDEITGEIIIIEENDNEEEEIETTETSDATRIFTDQGDPEIDGLHGRWKRGKLILRPIFQRNFVWDDIKSSKLIESALLDIPLPMIYLSEENNGTVTVIDGQQRLTAFFNFIDNKYSLKGLEKLKSISGSKSTNSKKGGKFFKDLTTDQQDKIQYTKLRVITFKKECDESLKFDVFERLNTGAVSLNAQELRNCIYHGEYNELLKEMAEYPSFKKILGESKIGNRMLDVELVLRFTSLFHRNIQGSLKKFMTDDMNIYKNISEKDSEELRNAFKNGLAINRSLFGNNMFKKYNKNETNNNGSWGGFSTVLYEILMVSLSKYDKNLVYRHLDEIREAWLDLIIDSEFLTYINFRTANETSIKRRFKLWNDRLDKIFAHTSKEPRSFSFGLKEELYEADSTCAICGNKIIHIDDSAVDHIEQYWLGGKTIPVNARLTHRFCNNSRPRIENI